MHERILLLGRKAALDSHAGVVAAARSAGYQVVFKELDPQSLSKGFFGKFIARRKLHAATKECGYESGGLVVLVELPGDSVWEPWMVYTAGSGLKKIAVPDRLKGVDNIAGVRSGVTTYVKLETVEDLDLALCGAGWEVQKCAYSAKM